ncbi:hypothetical protein M8J77_001054 [Diaphorina citri]|nr:hypothetical protein M8J77_001054 [Diaphorina citri]
MFSKFIKHLRQFDSISRRRLHSSLLDIAPEIQYAFHKKLPVLSLESTILTHGMPYPENITTAMEVQHIARNQGVVPATVGIIDGRIKVGLSDNQIEELGHPNNKHKTVKTSRRDLPYVLSQKLSGGTTVSGTLVISSLVGIRLFVTGGIGGVHYDGENTMDVSSDLVELGRHGITVVSAGVKSILDIGRTLEYLETQGVCVVTFGPSRIFPSFYTRQSAYEAPYNVDNVEDAARLVKSLQDLNVQSGILLGVPIPEACEVINAHDMDQIIQTCLAKCKKENIRGKQITPYLLDQVAKLSGGKSLQANIGLIKNNVYVGSRILAQWNLMNQ